jgi:bacteriorhodopsin
MFSPVSGGDGRRPLRVVKPEISLLMRFIDSILLLVAVVACVGVAYFTGHALAAHQIRWGYYAVGSLVVAVGVGSLLVHRLRAGKREPGRTAI